MTFLFTDIEGSTRLWETVPESMRAALERHDKILRSAIESRAGYIFSTGGDGFAAAFAGAAGALDAANTAQNALESEAWPEEACLRVRMGLHTGEATEREGNYFGPALNRAARLMALGHGGQILTSSATAELLEGAALTDLGEHRLRDLSAPMRIYQVGTRSFPKLRSVENFPTNLPSQMSSFIGRDQELARLSKALGESRVVTLTGVGGVGKTRLALQGAAEMLPRFRDGAWLVELAPLRDPEAVPGAVAAVFGVTPHVGQSTEQALVEFFRAKALLLILDNCEHLLDPVGDLVEALERSCPSLAVLATSREGLAVEGERILAVPSLDAPAPGADVEASLHADAVSLFVDRASAVDADFDLTDQNASAVAQICRRLDGVPLAIELAAARVGAMTPAELARALERRFDTLAGRRRRAVERHQTLRAAIDWSYDLCIEGERRLLARLAVFVGGCTRTAVEAICAGGKVDASEVFELLASLVAKSLVVAQRDGPQTRYNLLETIREYAEERLAECGETAAARGIHARYYYDKAAAYWRDQFGPDQVDGLRFLASEEENLVAALAHAVDTADVDLAVRLVRSVTRAGSPVGTRSDVALSLDSILHLPGASDRSVYPIGVALRAMHATLRGDQLGADAGFEEALSAAPLFGPETELHVEQLVVGVRMFAAWGLGRWREAADHAEQAIARFRSGGRTDTFQAQVLIGASAYLATGDRDKALPLAIESLHLARKMRAPLDVAFSQLVLAGALVEDEPDRARELLHDGIHTLETFGTLNPVDAALTVWAAAWTGDWPLALELAPRAIRQLHWAGYRPQLANIFRIAARAIAPNDPETAAVLLGVTRHIAIYDVSTGWNTPLRGESGHNGETVGSTSMLAELQRQTSRLVTEGVHEDVLHALVDRGESMREDEAVEWVLAAIDRARNPGQLSMT